MTARQVVVTGMGAVSAAGVGWTALWEAARDGRSAIRALDFARDYPGRIRIGAQVPDFDPAAHLDRATLLYSDPFAQYALVAADEAVREAGLTRETVGGENCAVILGTGIGGIRTVDDGLFNIYVNRQRPEVMSVPKLIASAGPSLLSIRFDAHGPVFAVASACSSASQAIGMGMHMVRSGMAERAIVGGSEASLSVGTQYTWEQLRVLTPDKCRPFSKGRNGMSIGDGAGLFILETEEAARARGAPILCRLTGYGTSADARDAIRPDVDGATLSMARAVKDAGIDPAAIDYVNAHGTATALNDPTEAEAMGRIFGERLATLPVSSTKPIHGHGLGAAGALELVCTIAALRHGVAPPTINFLEPDPKCPVDCVPNVARKVSIRAAMSNSFAFGGINASLIVQAAA
ncbi:MAG: beta-ketoacyl-[acyl-carrier-protein] synthase family protein [Hyphomicrobiales bacterium]|nr:beta-ketoacyl-[acyl-carrier-protein] synthase family protein [Hyphomicrobiales bacterium]